MKKNFTLLALYLIFSSSLSQADETNQQTLHTQNFEFEVCICKHSYFSHSFALLAARPSKGRIEIFGTRIQKGQLETVIFDSGDQPGKNPDTLEAQCNDTLAAYKNVGICKSVVTLRGNR